MEYPKKDPGGILGIKDHTDWPRLWSADMGAVTFAESIRAGYMTGVAKPQYTIGQIQAMVALCHGLSFAAGWYCNPETGKLAREFSVPEKIALIHSELSEALEADRKQLRDDKLPHRWGIEVELADAIIRIFDLAGALGLDLGGAFKEKLDYNITREDHSLSGRGGEHGKSY